MLLDVFVEKINLKNRNLGKKTDNGLYGFHRIIFVKMNIGPVWLKVCFIEFGHFLKISEKTKISKSKVLY